MKKIVILASGVIAGIIVSGVLYVSSVFWLVPLLPSELKQSLSLAFLVVWPSCLMLGSVLTGFLCRPFVGRRLTWLFLCPGVYGSLLFAAGLCYNPDEEFGLQVLIDEIEFAGPLAIPAVSASILGLLIGAHLRARMSANT